MKLLRESVEKYLETAQPFRERKNKNVGIVNLLMRRHPLLNRAIEMDMLTKQDIVTMVEEYASMDRAWRKVLEERPELRGSDYEDKAELEKETRLELGYNG